MWNKEKDYVYVVWKNPETRQRFVIGQITKNGGYEFSYTDEIRQAMKSGFSLLIAFPCLDTVYKNDLLFPAFSSRLPDRKRKDIDVILKKYGVDEFEEYELLKKSGARLPIDTLEFVDPILGNDYHGIKRHFYLAGSRYYLNCGGENCDKVDDGLCDYGIKLMKDPDNKNDPYAIKVLNCKEQLLGYIPRYYTKQVTDCLEKGYEVHCKLNKFQKKSNCNECINVELEII